jgi:uncharacterized cupredoxin-like copper-binding protein
MSSHVLPCTMLALAGVLVSCKSDRPAAGAESPATPPAAAPAPVPAAPITVTATDFKLDLPDTIPAGVVGLRLVNQGKELHQAQVVRLDDGKTLADFQQAMKHEGPPPSWVKFVGGPNGIAPGQEATAMAALVPGNYLMLCLIPSPDGVSHLMKGMIHPFTVAGPAGAAAALPAADDTVKLVDYGFNSSRPLTAGRHTILVENAAQQLHELVLLRLAPGKSVHDFGTWATTGGMKGPPPAMPMGGVAVIEHGESGTFTADLGPGSYGLICFVPDAKDGKLHLQHGMMKDFKVE